jgi:hypothetical protein
VPAPTPGIAAEEIRRDATLVEEDQARGVEGRRLGVPRVPRGDDLRPILFGRADCFF